MKKLDQSVKLEGTIPWTKKTTCTFIGLLPMPNPINLIHTRYTWFIRNHQLKGKQLWTITRQSYTPLHPVHAVWGRVKRPATLNKLSPFKCNSWEHVTFSKRIVRTTLRFTYWASLAVSNTHYHTLTRLHSVWVEHYKKCIDCLSMSSWYSYLCNPFRCCCVGVFFKIVVTLLYWYVVGHALEHCKQTY